MHAFSKISLSSVYKIEKRGDGGKSGQRVLLGRYCNVLKKGKISSLSSHFPLLYYTLLLLLPSWQLVQQAKYGARRENSRDLWRMSPKLRVPMEAEDGRSIKRGHGARWDCRGSKRRRWFMCWEMGNLRQISKLRK